MIFYTSRLIICNYRDEEWSIFAAIAAKPETRLFHTRVVSRARSDEFIDQRIETIDTIGLGYAVVERKADGAVVGDVGLRPMPDDMPIPGDVHFEIGWQLDPHYFGRGLARPWLSGARDCENYRLCHDIQHGFGQCHEAHRHELRCGAGFRSSQGGQGLPATSADGLFR